MELTFGGKIKEARKTIGLTQKQLAGLIGAAHNSISDWENDKNKPDPDTIELLCGVLKITPNYLLASSEDDFSPKEKLLIRKYRLVSEHSPDGASVVDTVLDREYSMAKQLKEQKEHMEESESEKAPIRIINYYYRLASAGTGQILFDMPPTKRIEIPDLPEYRKADYAIEVNGNSMEPTYHDGDTLLVEMTEQIEIGEIGIFSVNNECFVKKLGQGELISLNPKATNIPLNETARCMGRVVGKL